MLVADWPAPPHIHAFTSLRSGPGVSLSPFDRFNLGARCGDEAAHVQANRERLHRLGGLPASPQWLQQVHGTTVARFDRPVHSARPDRGCGGPAADAAVTAEFVADAAVTVSSGTVLAILTADCLPVLFCNRDGSEVAAAHAGWRGLAAGVLEATVRAMHSKPGEVLAWLGPAAGPHAYEVGDEVRAAFVSADACAADKFVPTRPQHWLMDMYALARQRLRAIGLIDIYGGAHCTISEPQHFFSHRRDQRSGRMASVVWME
ncbi:MAG: peptidoglycan editing factor PgeF [Arenimonas sp.]